MNELLEDLEVVRLGIAPLDENYEDDLHDEGNSPYVRALLRVALSNAVAQRDAYLERRGEYDLDGDRMLSGCDTERWQRAIVNFLRHNASNYDELLVVLNADTEDFDDFSEYYPEGDDPDSDSGVDSWEEYMDWKREQAEDNYQELRRAVHAKLGGIYPEVSSMLAAQQ